MKSIKELTDLKGKKVLLRTDFDVPVENKKIQESFRIERQKSAIEYLLDKGASVVMVAHISSVDSFEPILPELEKILGRKIKLVQFENLEIEKFNKNSKLKIENLLLLDNVRNWPGEEKNDETFSRSLASGFDVYINNAFAVCHRKHASVSAITKFLPPYSGFLLEEEIYQLEKMITTPEEGKIIIMGGAKASTKVPVIKNFIDKAESILVGGVIANDILKARGVDIGLSVADENLTELLEGLDISDRRLVTPVDYNIFENKIYDIGPKTIDDYLSNIEGAEVIIWNGPMGLFEDDRFSAGTDAIAEAVAGSSAVKTIGGGDTIAAVDRLGLIDKFDPSASSGRSFVSTGGGAMLAFLAGERLPGLEALGYYEK